MTVANKKTVKRLKKLPPEERYKRLQDIFKQDFIRSLVIEPSLYAYQEKEGSKKGGNRGIIAKRSYVHRIFAMTFDLIVHRMIEEGGVFKAPLYPAPMYMFFCSMSEEKTMHRLSYKRGVFTEVNPIDCDFKLYRLLLVAKDKFPRIHPVKIPYDSYRRVIHLVNKGMRYVDSFVYKGCEINTLSVPDFRDEVLELHPGLTNATYLKIMKEGFKKIRAYKNQDYKININCRRYSILFKL